MNATRGYAARIDELESLRTEFETPTRPGDPGPLVGRALEAAGDLLRRAGSTPHDAALIRGVLSLVPLEGLKSWSEGLRFDELEARFDRVIATAMEAAIPDDGSDAETLRGWAMNDLMSRDRIESALLALERSGRNELASVAKRLRGELASVDSRLRRRVHGLTPLNAERRREAALLDAPLRETSWWLTARAGIDDDALVRVLGGEATGVLRDVERAVDEQVNDERRRGVTFDELLRYDAGVASAAERAVIDDQASRDLELKRALAAMAAGETAIVEQLRAATPSPKVELAFAPTAAVSTTEVVAERPGGTVLLFRSPRRLQVVLQPRGARVREAALFISGQSGRKLEPREDVRGLSFDLGAPEKTKGQSARLEVTARDGARWSVEVPLS